MGGRRPLDCLYCAIDDQRVSDLLSERGRSPLPSRTLGRLLMSWQAVWAVADWARRRGWHRTERNCCPPRPYQSFPSAYSRLGLDRRAAKEVARMLVRPLSAPRNASRGRGTLLLSFTFMALFHPVSAAEPGLQRLDGSALTPREVDATVTQLMAAAEVTGVGIAIFNKGKVAYLKTYGLRDKEKSLPLTPDSVMTAASLTKPAFATVVMQLVAEGTLRLDRPVHEYLPKPLPEYPSFRDLAGDKRYRQITLRMLLSHTSGFPNWRAFNDQRRLSIAFPPGSKYAYSGEGILLAQLVVEAVTNRPLNVLMLERLFGPNGMTRTGMVWDSRFEDDFANGYDEWGRSLGPERRLTADAAGSMQTTLRDYASFLQAFLQGRDVGKKAREQMLSAQVEILSKHQFPTLATDTTTDNKVIRLSYGLGWGLYWTPYGRAFFKEGHDVGWRHYAVCFDKSGTGILIMTNSANGEGIFQPLLETLLGNTFTPVEWEGFAPYDKLPPRAPLKEHTEVAVDPTVLDRCVGRYRVSAGIVLAITREGSRLFVQENNEPKQELGTESERQFFSKTASDEYTCQLDGKGHATTLTLHTDGDDIAAQRAAE
jgi:CubicO group peptidase (beta-lactamase class C family)